MGFMITIGAVVSFLLGVVSIIRVRNEYLRSGTLSNGTVILVWLEYIFHSLIVAWAAWYAPWRVTSFGNWVVPVGGVLLIAGVAIAAIGIYQFGSLQRMSGQDTSHLVTGGIYQRSRNPQNVGWYLGLFGISLIGKSPLAFGLTLAFMLMLHIYIVWVEEPFLRQEYGEEFEIYHRNSARYWGKKDSGA